MPSKGINSVPIRINLTTDFTDIHWAIYLLNPCRSVNSVVKAKN
jgi:hypothetical protein